MDLLLPTLKLQVVMVHQACRHSCTLQSNSSRTARCRHKALVATVVVSRKPQATWECQVLAMVDPLLKDTVATKVE